jgi:hypothetical protein
VKLKTCKWCKSKFEPKRPTAICCSPDCEFDYGIKHAAKAEMIRKQEDRKVIKLKLDKLKTAREWTKEAQIAFNAYIRERDKNKPCICCGQPLKSGDVGGAFDCGHYRSVGSAPHLRFDERNAHGQRKQCNRYGAGRAVDYRIGLIARLGIDSVESLEADQTPRKYSIDELKTIKSTYKQKAKELKNG